jgi:hypothetical protein
MICWRRSPAGVAWHGWSGGFIKGIPNAWLLALDFADDLTGKVSLSELFGQQVMVTVEGTTTSDNGKVFNKVKFNGYAPF